MLSAEYAHDLRMVVQVMVSCAQMIQRDVGRAEEYANLLAESGATLEKFLTAALEEKRQDYFCASRETGDVLPAIMEAVVSFKPRASQRGVRLRLSCERAAICAPVDREKLSRMVMNLLSNAVRYARSDVEVLVEAEDCLKITVSDDGPGFAGELFGGAFKGEETGVGLQEVRHFSALHGGSVRALRENNRTKLVVALPLT